MKFIGDEQTNLDQEEDYNKNDIIVNTQLMTHKKIRRMQETIKITILAVSYIHRLFYTMFVQTKVWQCYCKLNNYNKADG